MKLPPPSLLVGTLCLAAFVPLVLPNDRIIDQPDYYSYQLPTREFERQELLAGRFPLWIPSIGYGLPLLAGQQATVCYPLLTPLLLVFPANYAIRLAIFLHLALAFWGVTRLARAFGLGPWPAAFAALVAVGGGFPAAHLNAGHVTVLVEFALVPWFFLAVLRLLKAPDPWPCAAVAVLVALFVFAGHPQLPYYALLFAAFWTAASLARGAAAQHRGQVLAWSGLAALVAGLLVLVQVLPALELMRDGQEFSDRGSAERAGTQALRPIDLLTLLQPNCMGNLYAQQPAFLDQDIAYHERAAYAGLATIPLVLLTFARRRKESWEWGALGLCVFSVIVALGNATPLFAVLGKLLPGLWAFRCPGRILAVASLFYALLAARGLETLLSRNPDVERGRLALLALGLVLLLVGFPLLALQASGVLPDYMAYVAAQCRLEFAATGVAFVLALATLLLARRVGMNHPGLACFLLVAVTSADLWYFCQRHVSLVERPVEAVPPFPPEARLPVRFSQDYDEAWHFQYSNLVEVASRRGCATPLTNEGGYLPASLHRLYLALADRETSREALAVSATDYVYHEEKKTWEPVAVKLPRIRFEPAGEEEDSQHLVLSTQYSVLSTQYSVPEASLPTSAVERTPTVLEDTPQHTRLQIRAPVEGRLVVADTYYSGWVCRVDGMEVPIQLAHGSFRGVPLSPGTHEVEFEYQPASFRYGLIGSAIGLAFLLGLVGFASLRSRQARSGFTAASRKDHSL